MCSTGYNLEEIPKVTQDNLDFDRYEHYEALFDPSWVDPVGPRRKFKVQHKPKVTQAQIIARLADDLTDVELGFQTSYQLSKTILCYRVSSLSSLIS